MRQYLILVFLFVQLTSLGQTSPLDNQKTSNTDTIANKLKKDSNYSRVEFRNNPIELQKLRDKMNEEQRKEQRRTYTRMILIIILITIVVIVIIRRKQNNKGN